jgi:hypothetical protein
MGLGLFRVGVFEGDMCNQAEEGSTAELEGSETVIMGSVESSATRGGSIKGQRTYWTEN